MRIEVSPSQATHSELTLFNASFFRGTRLVAEIKDAPHEIATKWAEVMRELHGGHPEIKRNGVCHYCGSTQRQGHYCNDCGRVFTR